MIKDSPLENQKDQAIKEGKNENKSGLFENTLSQVTTNWIKTKYQLTSNNDLLQKMDLRHLCQQVVNELESVKQEAAFDYLKISDEILHLNDQIDTSDDILGDLEELLMNFKDHLGNIKNDMTNLQFKSLQMNTCINNRKTLQQLTEKFLSSALLEPSLISHICNDPIDESYVQHIKVLCSKIQYLENQHMTDSKSVQELEPELNKLKNQACLRVRNFLLEKIGILRKPSTNVQIIQDNELLQYNVFTAFLKDHYIKIYLEVWNIYCDSMSKFYFSKIKGYMQQILKLYKELYNKNDSLLPDIVHIQQPNAMRGFLDYKGKRLTSNEQSIFSFLSRDSVLQNMTENPIMVNIASKNNQMVLIEHAYKSLSFLLIDGIISEFVFTKKFFNLSMEQNKKLFSGIFKQINVAVLDSVRQLVCNSMDCVGILLIILLNENFKKIFSSQQIHLLDQYFEMVNQVCWPRFEQLFEWHLESIKGYSKGTVELQKFKQFEHQVGIKNINQRFIDFTVSLYIIYCHLENKMLEQRLILLKKEYFNLIQQSALQIMDKTHRKEYLINIYDSVNKQFELNAHMMFEKPAFHDDLQQLEVTVNDHIAELIDSYIQDAFRNLYEFVTSFCMMPTASTQNFNAAQNIQQQQNVDASQHKFLIENIGNEWSSSWVQKVESIQMEAESRFLPDTAKKINQKFMLQLSSYYNSFFKYVKEKHGVFVNQLIPVHAISQKLRKS